jgi:DNA-binding transcriptional LysR family regulator
VELSQVRAFVAVSRQGTIAAAAEELHVTPSPLSRTIRDLERQVGGDLFRRNYHQFDRTDLGDRFLPLAVEIVAQAEEAASLVSGARRGLRFGATPWTSRALTDSLAAAVTAVGGTTNDLVSDLSSVLLDSLRHGDIDIALVHLPLEATGVASLPLAQYSFAFASLADPSLDLGRPLHLADLAGRRVLTLPLLMQPVSMQHMRDAFERAGIVSVEEVDLRDIVGIQGRMARTGQIMLVSRGGDLPTSRLFDFDQLEVYPLADGEIDTVIGLAWRERDTVHASELGRIIERLRPRTDEIPYIG